MRFFKDTDIGCIVIATPATLHFDITEKALKAGKHVFVEKPLSLNHANGEKLVQLAVDNKKILFVAIFCITMLLSLG